MKSEIDLRVKVIGPISIRLRSKVKRASIINLLGVQEILK